MASPSSLVIGAGEKIVLSFVDLTVEICQGDLTLQTGIDAIVCPTDRRLQHAMGISSKIRLAAGDRFNIESDLWLKNNGSLETGDTAYTSGGNLPAKFVIHTVGPNFNDDCNGLEEVALSLLQFTYTSCFDCAKKLEIKSVALPGIGTGYGQIPARLSACAAVAVLCDMIHSDSVGSIKLVRFVNVDIGIVKDFAAEFQNQMHLFPDAVLFSEQSDTTSTCSTSASGEEMNGVADDNIALCSGRQNRLAGSQNNSDKMAAGRSEGEGKGGGIVKEEDTTCSICMDDFESSSQSIQKLEKCSHKFHCACIQEVFRKMQPQCPVCKVWYGIPEGKQPKNGKMFFSISKHGSLPGFIESGHILISYNFPNGVQGQEHLRPGVPYTGTTRKAYLPNNAEGHVILKLLQKAFEHRLTFTIGDSVTSGAKNTVVWNNIHHKTSMQGGAEYYGFPDPNYLKRVEEELAAVGITRDMIK